jgi:hypothetical protein
VPRPKYGAHSLKVSIHPVQPSNAGSCVPYCASSTLNKYAMTSFTYYITFHISFIVVSGLFVLQHIHPMKELRLHRQPLGKLHRQPLPTHSYTCQHGAISCIFAMRSQQDHGLLDAGARSVGYSTALAGSTVST